MPWWQPSGPPAPAPASRPVSPPATACGWPSPAMAATRSAMFVGGLGATRGRRCPGEQYAMSDGGVALRSLTVGADEGSAEAPVGEAAVVVLAAGAFVADADRVDRPGG